tara:strand:- start:610 stop:840 length:231 start_codon:yes stop_codon:yes gene_type:complete
MIKVKLFLGLCVFALSFSYPQCAMCRVVAESNQEAGGTIANGLNSGILYLMACPYVLILCGLIWMYYRRDKASVNN